MSAAASPYFPGLPAPEAVVLQAWLDEHAREYTRFEFNVRIGSGVDPGPLLDDATRRQAILNTQRRIDVVAWKGDSPTIIEVKVRAGAAAVGQIVVYEHLWLAENRPSGGLSLLIVCNTHSPDIDGVTARYGIGIVDVPADLHTVAPLTH